MAYDFEASDGIIGIRGDTTDYGSIGTAHTQAALCTVESLPSGGNYPLPVGMESPTVARIFAIFINGDASADFQLAISSSVAAPSPVMIPPTGVPLLIAISKPAGTVAPRFLIHNYATSTTTYNASGGTIANRSTGVCTASIGTYDLTSATRSWDGLIGAVAQWNRALTEAELRQLVHGRSAWLSMFGRGVLTGSAEMFVDLTQPGTIRDQFNGSISFTATGVSFGPSAIRWPGW